MKISTSNTFPDSVQNPSPHQALLCLYIAFIKIINIYCKQYLTECCSAEPHWKGHSCPKSAFQPLPFSSCYRANFGSHLPIILSAAWASTSFSGQVSWMKRILFFYKSSANELKSQTSGFETQSTRGNISFSPSHQPCTLEDPWFYFFHCHLVSESFIIFNGISDHFEDFSSWTVFNCKP